MLEKKANLGEWLGKVSTFLWEKYIKFCFQNLENGRED